MEEPRQTSERMKFESGPELMKDLQMAKEEPSITKTGKNMCEARELLKIMAGSESSEKFSAACKT